MDNKQIKDFYDERNLVPEPKNLIDTTDSEVVAVRKQPMNFNTLLRITLQKLSLK